MMRQFNRMVPRWSQLPQRFCWFTTITRGIGTPAFGCHAVPHVVDGFQLSRIGLDRPASRQHLRLFEYRLCRFLLLVRRITVLAQDALHQPAEVCAYVLA